MNPDPIVFALANPDPEVAPEEAIKYARIIAIGRSDYPNQINNVLCFPGCSAVRIPHNKRGLDPGRDHPTVVAGVCPDFRFYRRTRIVARSTSPHVCAESASVDAASCGPVGRLAPADG
jgi:hypothetical protein